MRNLRLWALALAALLVQLLVLSEIRPWGTPANVINVLTIGFGLAGNWGGVLVAGLLPSLVLEAFSLGGLGLAGLGLLASAYFVYRLRDVFGTESVNRFFCLALGLALNQALQFCCLHASGVLAVGQAGAWRVLLRGTGMDVALALPLYLGALVISRRMARGRV